MCTADYEAVYCVCCVGEEAVVADDAEWVAVVEA